MKSRVTTALIVMLMASWFGGCGGEQPARAADDLRASTQSRPQDRDDREEHDQPRLRVRTQGR